MRARPTSYLAIALLCLAAIPFVTDAGIAVPPASKAACCAVIEPPPPPAPKGDEEFFQIPGGVPNVMLLLDTSGSMLEFPRDFNWQTFSLSGSSNQTAGTCALQTPFVNDSTAYDITDPKYDVPYDNGYATGLVTDDPPWGLTRCQAKQPRPTTDGAQDWCLYRPDSYYKFVNGAAQTAGTFWNQTSARVYNANPCAVVNAAGQVQLDSTGAVANADATACDACLSSKGYFMYAVRYRNSSGTWTTSPTQIVFSGRFLNAFPQKYVVARKVVKDIVKLDAASPTTTDSVRFGLTVFVATNTGGFSTSLRTNDGGKLVVPVGPNCTQSFPVTTTAFAPARQAVVDAVDAIDSSWNPTQVPFGGSTPLAEALFNVGQYFTNTGATGLYTSLFGNKWVRSSFAENAAGSMNVSWAQAGMNQHSFCWACEQSSVVVITDGAPNQDSNLPSGSTTTAHSTFGNDFRYWSNSTIDCPTCKCDLSYGGSTCTTPTPLVPSGGQIPNMLHKVAYFLKATDLRPDLSNSQQQQSLSTYTISFGIDASGTAPADDKAGVAVLQKTADLGGGLFSNTSSGDELRAALNTAVSDVVARATSFSSASANALQTSKTNQADAYLGRFRPTNSSMWEGHLFAAMLFDEFGQGCDSRFSTAGQKSIACGTKAAQNPNMNGDETADGKAICTSAYLVDSDCDPIVEDATGNFKKGFFDASHGLVNGPDDAALFWDAGSVLSDPTKTGYRSAQEGVASSRVIKTVLDVNGDGKYTAADGLVDFTVDNVAALAPAMGLDFTWCTNMLKRIGICGLSPLPACPATWTAAAQQLCATQVIHFVRGWDVLDWDNDHCAGPGNYYNTNGWGSCTSNAQCGSSATCTSGKCVNTSCPNGEQRDRVNDSRSPAAQEFWKLGDIFHSSPVLVKPPIDKILCKFGADNQCVMTLYSAPGQSTTNTTPMASYGVLDAYDKYRSDNLNRPMVVVVGANDGMLHAFDAGVADTSQPAKPDGQFPYTAGTGAELWAFIPPDLLPRLKNAMDAHQYFVDGNTMVRDVWVDQNGDGTKQANEFHTVAILSERGGGTRFTALDVTSPTSPVFLWSFPEGCSALSPNAGQSWSDFLPRPPPIGPVRLRTTGADPLGRGFEERWVVMLNGGYDPAMVRGRYVAMLDVWTGALLWQYTNADFQAMRGDTKASMMPVAATVGMVDIGKADTAVGTFDTDGYFDTATWGDMGGNVFVARMHDPGTLDATTKLVTNWTAARTFEMNRRSDDDQAALGKSPFFYMTANYVETPSRLYTLLGSGNRERLLTQAARCGPDNLLACCQAQCSVASATFSANYGTGSCSTGGTFTCNGGDLVYTPGATSGCSTPYACGAATQSVTLNFDCGAAGKMGPITAQLTCDATGSCSVNTDFSAAGELAVSSLMPACGPGAPRDCFFSVWSYGVQQEKLFTNTTEALAFEKNRFTDVPGYSGCGSIGTCSVVNVTHALSQDTGLSCLDGSTKCRAAVGDPGWKYCYGLRCPTAGCTDTWCDERTGSGPFGSRTCIGWSSFRATGAVAGSDPCTTSSGTPTSFNYVADFREGIASAQCNMYTLDTGSAITYGRANVKNAFAAPQNASRRIVVNARGEVNYSALKIEAGSGAEKIDMGTRQNVAEPLYLLEVPRVVHSCRHVDANNCE